MGTAMLCLCDRVSANEERTVVNVEEKSLTLRQRHPLEL